MESTQQKVDRLQAELDALNAQSPRNDSAINQTAIALDEAKRELEQEQAAQVRIQDATEKAAYLVDNIDIEGLTMRDLTVGEKEYQVLRIAVQNQFINQTEEFSQQIAEIQAAENDQQARLKQQLADLQAKFDEDTKQVNADQETIATLRAQLAQEQREKEDYIGKLKNATDEIDRLNSQVDDLRKEIAVGARNAYKVTDVEQTQQLKQLADQIKASRIHVYDVEPDSTINPRNYTATRADNGQPVTYNWTQAKNYIEIKDPNEVEQFRQQFANQNVVPDISLAEPVQDSLVPEVPLPTLPSVIAPEANVPTEVQLAIPAPTDGGQGEVTREEFEALKKRVVELETVCNVNESSQAVA